MLNLRDVVARHLARNIGLRSFCCRYVVIGARTVTPWLAENASG
jgi:hypothetical protein